MHWKLVQYHFLFLVNSTKQSMNEKNLKHIWRTYLHKHQQLKDVKVIFK